MKKAERRIAEAIAYWESQLEDSVNNANALNDTLFIQNKIAELKAMKS